MILLEEFDIVLGVGANGLREVGRDGVEEVKVDRGVVFKLATDDGVVRPLHLDKVSNLLGSILGDF